MGEINVLVRHTPIADISNYLPIESFKPFRKKYRIDLINLPENIKVIPVPLMYLPTDTGYKKLGEKHYRSVENIIKKYKLQFDLIHAHFTWSAGYVGARLKERYNIPLIVTSHGYDIYDLPFRNSKWTSNIEYVLNSADHNITVSQSNLKFIKKLNVNKPASVIYNGFDPKFFRPIGRNGCRQNLNLPLNKRIILTVGHLLNVKGHKYLIKAMEEVVTKRNDVIFYVVGSGSLKKNLEKQIRESGLKDFISLVGLRPHKEIPLWINASDLFVLPSLFEGNPTVMFECLGCGTPFIGTRVGGIPEIIDSEDYGFLAEPSDPASLSDNIFKALNKKWDKIKILDYSSNFTWDKITKQILGIYSKILTG